MAEIEGVAVEKIEGFMLSDDKTVALVGLVLAGDERLALAVTQENLQAIIHSRRARSFRDDENGSVSKGSPTTGLVRSGKDRTKFGRHNQFSDAKRWLSNLRFASGDGRTSSGDISSSSGPG